MQVALTPVQLIGDPVFKRHVLGNYAPGQYEERTTPYVPPPPSPPRAFPSRALVLQSVLRVWCTCRPEDEPADEPAAAEAPAPADGKATGGQRALEKGGNVAIQMQVWPLSRFLSSSVAFLLCGCLLVSLRHSAALTHVQDNTIPWN